MRYFIIMAVVCAMLLFGCTGQAATPNTQQAGQQPGGQPQAGAPQQPQAPSGQANGTPLQGGQQTGQQTAGAQEQPSTTSASDEFASILGLRSTLQYKVAYDVATEAAGQQMSVQMSQYIKGLSKMRTDSTYSGIESRTYLLDKTFYTCTKQAAWNCMKMAVQEEQGSTQAMDNVQSNISDYQVVADGTMQVAGVTATCYKVTGKDIEYYRSCHSPEGVPLYIKMQTSAAGQSSTTEMTASSYSTSVPDSDFVLPAAATELPTAGAGAAGAVGIDACSYCSYLTGSSKDQCLASCAK